MDSLRKLQQAQAALNKLEWPDEIGDMELNFGIAVSAMVASRDKAYADTLARVKSAPNAQVSAIPRFKAWWSEEIKSMEADPLIKWIIGSRNDEQHLDIRRGGISPSAGSLNFGPLRIGQLRENERFQINFDGMWIVENEDTPYEKRRRPDTRDDVSLESGRIVISFALLNMPAFHLGEPLDPSKPVVALRLAFDYFVNLRQRCIDYKP